MRIRPRHAKIALVAGFGAIVLAARLYAFYTDNTGIAGTIATVATLVLLVGGVVAIFIGFRSVDWTRLRSNKRRRRR